MISRPLLVSHKIVLIAKLIETEQEETLNILGGKSLESFVRVE